jgi:hypothetical protein
MNKQEIFEMKSEAIIDKHKRCANCKFKSYIEENDVRYGYCLKKKKKLCLMSIYSICDDFEED